MVGSRDVGTPFLEATETMSELYPHRDFSLRVHPGATTPQHSSPLLWRGMGLHGQDATQGLALACW